MIDSGTEASTKECGCLCRDPLLGEAAEDNWMATLMPKLW